MHNLSSLLPNALQSGSPSTTAEKSPLATKTMETLWLRLGEIYGHKWTAAYGTDATGSAAQTWAKGLNGLTAAQVAGGLKACLTTSDPWPPTLPEFRARCLGIPSLQEVRLEIHGSERSPFGIMVWQQLDGYLFKQSSADKSDRMLKDAYELAREMVMRGHPLPEMPAAVIEQQVREYRPASKESVDCASAEIERLFRISR